MSKTINHPATVIDAYLEVAPSGEAGVLAFKFDRRVEVDGSEFAFVVPKRILRKLANLHWGATAERKIASLPNLRAKGQ